jgi:hypothetical protein
VRERLVRLGHPEELAQGSPAFFDLVDEQALGRDAALDLFVVAFEDLYRVGFVLEAAVEGAIPDDLLSGSAPRKPAEGEEADEAEGHARGAGGCDHAAQLVDGGPGALVPAVRVADAEEHLRFRVALR